MGIKTLRPSSLVVEHSVVVKECEIESYGQPIFSSRFMKFMFRIIGGIKC